MALRERIIPCADFQEWKHDLELTGNHVIDSTPEPGRPGFCTLRFEADVDNPGGPGLGFAAVSFATPVAALAAAPVQGALSATQARTAQAIINIFETGTVLGRYGQVTLIEHDAGHLTFGRSQSSLGSGNLGRMIAAYCGHQGARFGARLATYLPRMNDRDFSLDNDFKLHNLLRASADDPVMRDTQDRFFDRGFWQPAQGEAAALGIRTPLGVTTVYDSLVHGSWGPLRDLTIQHNGSVAKLGEQAWISAYIANRRSWMAGHARPDIRATVYRMDTLAALAQHDQWSLQLPLLVRDQEISEATLNARPSDCYDGPAPGSRPLAVTSPFERGLDVRLLQLGLSDANLNVKADGVFGAASAQSIKQYQKEHGLAVTGVADVALIAKLTA
jgi:chitosanase